VVQDSHEPTEHRDVPAAEEQQNLRREGILRRRERQMQTLGRTGLEMIDDRPLSRGDDLLERRTRIEHDDVLVSAQQTAILAAQPAPFLRGYFRISRSNELRRGIEHERKIWARNPWQDRARHRERPLHAITKGIGEYVVVVAVRQYEHRTHQTRSDPQAVSDPIVDGEHQELTDRGDSTAGP